jgi:hypothetical protein
MNTAPESIHQLERQSYDYGYNCGLAKHGELCAIIEDMAVSLTFLGGLSRNPKSVFPEYAKGKKAYDRYLAITTKSA